MDEVQCGFGLGGTFAWHSRFDLVARDGNPDGPDCVCFAKRAQVGVVMSRFEDLEPSSAHAASCVRGLVHAEMMAEDPYAEVLEPVVAEKLAEIAARFPELVRNPRNQGYAIAFDLPSPEHLNQYLEQRFWRGAIVFGAGDRTVRYRLSTAFTEREIDLLFDTIRRSLAWLDAHPGKKPPTWEDLPAPVVQIEDQPEERDEPELRIRRVTTKERDATLEEVMRMEERVYEPARRDDPSTLRHGFDDEDGIALVAEVHDGEEWVLVGVSLAAPLERFRETPGPDRDPFLGHDNTLYSIAITVDPRYRGFGLGKKLKAMLLEEARTMRRPDGTPRYRHLTARNRVGKTAAMMHVNTSYGAYELYRVKGAYDDPEAEALYYRMPVGAFAPEAKPHADDERPFVDLAGGVSRPFAHAPASLRRAAETGLLYGPAVNKITVMNYVTPPIVRAIEWVDALVPGLPHMYLTSSRDEAFDKAVRTLRFHRKDSQIVIGLDGGYVGHTTAAARSLSDSTTHRAGSGYFTKWRRVPHPSLGMDESIAALRAVVNEVGGPSKVIGFFVEPVQERTGRVLSEEYLAKLAALRAELDLPVTFVETASASYRSGRGAFASTGSDFSPDLLAWWGGGQIGFVHASPRWFVPTALTMVSTWDGDELSLIRVHHQLRAARNADVPGLGKAWAEALEPARERGHEVRGLGLYRVIDVGAGERAKDIARGLLGEGFRVRAFPNGHVAVVPPLDLGGDAAASFRKALAEVLA
jgi:4-aminobutyrate aminotransferase-like enzyme/GNAT superfamily N-acetyltransferase